MLLTVSLLSKGSFFGSLLNKCRQVTKIIKPKKSTNPTFNHNNNNSLSTPLPNNTTATVAAILPPANVNAMKKTIRPALSSSVAGLKTLEEQVGLPPKPKKPLTPYFRYMKDMRPKVTSENPKVSNIEVVRLISKRWETAEPSLKQRLQDEFKLDQQRYVEQRAKYDSKITDEQRAEIKQLKHEIVEAKERKQLRKRVKELGRPKKPASAFLRFIGRERIDSPQLPKQTYREWHQKCTAKWGRLTDEEKAPYMQESRKELEKYKKEISIWEEKMIRLGNIDVVRHGNLIDPPEPKPKKH